MAHLEQVAEEEVEESVEESVEEVVEEQVAEIRRRGWRLEVLSGDHPGTVKALMKRLALDPSDGRGGAVPEDKLERVRSAVADGAVVHTTSERAARVRRGVTSRRRNWSTPIRRWHWGSSTHRLA